MTQNRSVTARFATALQPGQPLSPLAGSKDDEAHFLIDVPQGATNLVISISGGTGDADLYVRLGSRPTESAYDCRPYLNGNIESCSYASTTAGRYHIMLHGWSAYSGVTLSASYSTPPTLNLPDHLHLSYATVSSTSHFDARRTITAGPSYAINSAGTLELAAGERITLKPGFRVNFGGRTQLRIRPELKP